MYAGMIEEFDILATLVAEFVDGCLVGHPKAARARTRLRHLEAKGAGVKGSWALIC